MAHASHSSSPDAPRSSDGHAGRRYYERVMRELDQDAPPAAVGAVLLQVARGYQEAGQYTAALDCCDAVLGLAGHDGMDPVLAELFELRGRLHCEVGNLEAAGEDFARVQEHAQRAGMAWLVALGHEHLASIAIVRQQWADAIGELERAAATFREADGRADLIRVLLQLATLYVDLRRWNAAEQTLADVMARATEDGDQAVLVRLELIRTQMAVDRSNAARARMSAERALVGARRVAHPALLAEAVAMNSLVARELGDLQRALQLLEDAERQALALDDTMLLGELACARVEVLARRDDHRATLQGLNRAYRALVRLLGEPGPMDRARRLRRLEQEFLAVTRRFAQRVEAVDHDTSGHVERVGDLTCEIARRMGVDPSSLLGYRIGAYLHDLGKVAVPASILNKRGRLTPDEWAAVKRHPVAGAELLAGTDLPWEVRPIVEGHHECWDGSGYPHGRAGEEIPLAARIACVADVYDALVTRRPFKHALASDEAVEVMRRDVGRQFDPAVFRVFEDVVREGIALPGVTSTAAMPAPEALEPELVDDPLTGVADFASWSRRATALLAARRSAGGEACVLLVDVDDFSRVNATYGRLQGDDVLWAVAKVLQRGLRSGDLIGRRSGDEFLVVLPDTGLDTTREVATRLQDGVRELRCARRDAADETLTVSVSIAIVHAPSDGESLASLLAAADRALFAATRDGRDTIVRADQAGPSRVQAALDFSTFTGREDELRVLTAHLDRATGGESCVVTITGESGIGKSALVRHLQAEVRLRSGWMVTGQATADGLGGPLAPWAGVVTRLVELGGTGDRGWLALPQWLPAAFPTTDPAATEAPLPQLQQEVVTFVRRAARQHPVTVVLEDMHLAPAASWAVLESLQSGADDERLLVLLTARPEVQPGVMEWRRRVQQHARHTTLTLRRFSLDDVRRWVRTVFHDAAPGDDVARWLHEVSEGIPRFVVHLLRAGCDDGTIWYGGTRWEWNAPAEGTLGSGVAWVLERRLDRVAAATRSVLASAALLHPDITVELLVSVTGVAESQARLAIEEAMSASILVAADGEQTRFDFAHPVLREACVRGIPERQRQQVHDVAARVLELRAPSAVATIAAHYHAAGNDEAAFGYARAAAERAVAGHAHDVALVAFQVAQRYAASSETLATLRVRHAEVACQAGRYAHAAALCDLALEWLDRQPASAAGIRGRRVREWVQWRRGRSAGRSAEVFRSLVEEAARVAPETLPATALSAAEAATTRAEWPEAISLARRALDDATRRQVEVESAAAMIALGEAEHAEHPAPARTRLREAVTRANATRDPRLMARAWHALGTALARQQPGAEAEELLGGALEHAREAHDAALSAVVSRTLGIVRGRLGQAAESAQWIGDAERLFTTLEDEPDRIVTLLEGARLLRDRGEREAACHQFDAVARRAREIDLTWVELAATAGAALSNGGAASEAGQARWARASELIADARADWWFPGREMVDAFAIEVALANGQAGVAHDLFLRAHHRVGDLDAWGDAWLVAECAPVLELAGVRSLARVRREAADGARQRGFVPLLATLG